MFGFVVADPSMLTHEQTEYYKSVYCGLCEDLGKDRKSLCRMALTYDLVFLALVLSALCDEEYTEAVGRCPVHPLQKRKFRRNRFTQYASDMNIALAYYKYLDDKNDDSSLTAAVKARLFEKEITLIKNRYPRQCKAIEDCLDELAKAEKENILLPDIPAGIFGRLLGSVFLYEESGYADTLYSFGEALGKFIYILDAVLDLKDDIKKQHYNPLVRWDFSKTEPVLNMLMGECIENYRKLPIKKDSDIIENILFSGIWTAYNRRKRKEKK